MVTRLRTMSKMEEEIHHRRIIATNSIIIIVECMINCNRESQLPTIRLSRCPEATCLVRIKQRTSKGMMQMMSRNARELDVFRQLRTPELFYLETIIKKVRMILKGILQRSRRISCSNSSNRRIMIRIRVCIYGIMCSNSLLRNSRRRLEMKIRIRCLVRLRRRIRNQ